MNRSKVTLLDLKAKVEEGQPITMLTAYDYPTALLVDQAGIDIILVGDSLARVVLGHENTLTVTMDEMLHHCRAVARGAKSALLVGDLPFLSYQVAVQDAIRNAGRLLKEGGMDVVKLEGGRQMASTLKAIVDAGISVMGHIGMTFQTSTKLGGYGVQGQDVAAARALIDDALALEDAGAFSLVLSTIPSSLAKLITERVSIPTIGIGAGPHCDGQVLVFHSLVGFLDRPVGKYVKQYANLFPTIMGALVNYRDEVSAGLFPSPDHAYEMSQEAWRALVQELGGVT